MHILHPAQRSLLISIAPVLAFLVIADAGQISRHQESSQCMQVSGRQILTSSWYSTRMLESSLLKSPVRWNEHAYSQLRQTTHFVISIVIKRIGYSLQSAFTTPLLFDERLLVLRYIFGQYCFEHPGFSLEADFFTDQRSQHTERRYEFGATRTDCTDWHTIF